MSTRCFRCPVFRYIYYMPAFFALGKLHESFVKKGSLCTYGIDYENRPLLSTKTGSLRALVGLG